MDLGEGMMDKAELIKTIDERLAELAALEEDWNNYRADRIDAEVIARVRKFFDLLDYVFPKPYLFPTPSGGINIEWEECKENRGLSIEFMRTGDIQFFLYGELTMDKPRGIRELMDWIRQ